MASELSGISEQSLRLYERQGLLTPARSAGGTRRYSADDLVRLQRISELVAAGVNLAGIDRILSLEDRNTALDERTSPWKATTTPCGKPAAKATRTSSSAARLASTFPFVSESGRTPEIIGNRSASDEAGS